mmetsp:Transcript_83149/g.240212  ORF Transcript_83149/g.240212 Transcript_83149/m.240212 type:complete len:205 (+) Transcript_83149:444-1058(+)
MSLPSPSPSMASPRKAPSPAAHGRRAACSSSPPPAVSCTARATRTKRASGIAPLRSTRLCRCRADPCSSPPPSRTRTRRPRWSLCCSSMRPRWQPSSAPPRASGTPPGRCTCLSAAASWPSGRAPGSSSSPRRTARFTAATLAAAPTPCIPRRLSRSAVSSAPRATRPTAASCAWPSARTNAPRASRSSFQHHKRCRRHLSTAP